MSIEQMRVNVAKAYPHCGWRTKVHAMTDQQIIAVHERLVAKGKIKF